MLFGVPQGSILGSMLFNLYVSYLQGNLPNSVSTFQKADDTTSYKRCRPTNLAESTEHLNTTLKALSSWSSDSHLALNPLSTRQMDVKISEEGLERVEQTKLLSVHFHEHVGSACKRTCKIMLDGNVT